MTVPQEWGIKWRIGTKECTTKGSVTRERNGYWTYRSFFSFHRLCFLDLSCFQQAIICFAQTFPAAKEQCIQHEWNDSVGRVSNHSVRTATQAAEVLLRFEPQQISSLAIFLLVPRYPWQLVAPQWHLTSGPNCTNLQNQNKKLIVTLPIHFTTYSYQEPTTSVPNTSNLDKHKSESYSAHTHENGTYSLHILTNKNCARTEPDGAEPIEELTCNHMSMAPRLLLNGQQKLPHESHPQLAWRKSEKK